MYFFYYTYHQQQTLLQSVTLVFVLIKYYDLYIQHIYHIDHDIHKLNNLLMGCCCFKTEFEDEIPKIPIKLSAEVDSLKTQLKKKSEENAKMKEVNRDLLCLLRNHQANLPTSSLYGEKDTLFEPSF